MYVYIIDKFGESKLNFILSRRENSNIKKTIQSTLFSMSSDLSYYIVSLFMNSYQPLFFAYTI